MDTKPELLNTVSLKIVTLTKIETLFFPNENDTLFSLPKMSFFGYVNDFGKKTLIFLKIEPKIDHFFIVFEKLCDAGPNHILKQNWYLGTSKLEVKKIVTKYPISDKFPK